MKIFVTIQENLMLMGINPHESGRFNLKTAMGFLLIDLNVLSSIILIFTLENDDLMSYVNGFISASTLIEMLCAFVAIVFQQMKLFKIIRFIEELINRRLKNAKSKEIYEDTNQRLEKISGVLFVAFVKVLPQFMIWPTFAMSFVKYFTTDLGADAFQLPLFLWVPFDWKCPLGYSIAVILQWISVTYVLFTIMILMACGIAGYLFATAVTEDIKCTLNAIDENTKTKMGRKWIPRGFSEFIESHATIKQAVAEFSALYQPIFMVLFLHSLLITCCAMLLIQMELSRNESHLMELLVIGFNAADTLFEVFISCELSQRLGNEFTDIYDLLDQFQWYRFPTKVKRILPTALVFVQQPVSLECFGTFVCCRDAFKRVLNTAYTNFMVLRRFIK